MLDEASCSSLFTMLLVLYLANTKIKTNMFSFHTNENVGVEDSTIVVTKKWGVEVMRMNQSNDVLRGWMNGKCMVVAKVKHKELAIT